MAVIRLFTTINCAYCRRAKELLKEQGLEFHEIDLTEDDELRDSMSRELRYYTVPMIFIGSKFIGGFDQLYALTRKPAELKALLDS